VCRTGYALGDGVGPALQRLFVLADVFVGRHEGGVVGKADGLADRRQKLRLAVELELGGIRLDEDRELVLPRKPRAHAGGDADIVHELDVGLWIEPVLAQRRLEEEERRAAGPEAE